MPPADRVSPPPAPASVRLTPLCHTQSQTERSSLPRPPPPPPPSRHLTGAHCAHGASFNRIIPAAFCSAPPGGPGECVNTIMCNLATVRIHPDNPRPRFITRHCLVSSMIAQPTTNATVFSPAPPQPPRHWGIAWTARPVELPSAYCVLRTENVFVCCGSVGFDRVAWG